VRLVVGAAALELLMKHKSLTLFSLLQTLSGRGDKDVQEISEILPGKWADKLDWRASLSSPLLDSSSSVEPIPDALSFSLADVDGNANIVKG
jgi:hypothetical protein